jgi:mono/diheme cytochrome c family protein
MKNIFRPTNLFLGVTIAAVSLVAEEIPKIKRVPARSTTAMTGKELFREYCAVCHGLEANGKGPAASALNVKPANLTEIAARNSGKFPEIRVQRTINGEDHSIAAHGSRDMPIWGPIFRSVSSNPDLGTVRVYNLVKYVESIQVK